MAVNDAMNKHPVVAVQHALEAAAACVRAVLPADDPAEDGEGMFAGDSAGKQKLIAS